MCPALSEDVVRVIPCVSVVLRRVFTPRSGVCERSNLVVSCRCTSRFSERRLHVPFSMFVVDARKFRHTVEVLCMRNT